MYWIVEIKYFIDYFRFVNEIVRKEGQWYKANGRCVEFTYNKSRYTTKVSTYVSQKKNDITKH